MEYIDIKGAKVHNLKNVSLKIPRHKLVVITGLSGSGKSSLAFDTIFAEAQRRYVDTLSSYARQFIGVLEKPDIESIDGLSPTIAIEQKSTNRNPRSTVGTITEISDFLRLLYARASIAYSPHTGKEMIKYSDTQIVSLIIEMYRDKRCLLLAPLVNGRKGHYKELFASMIKKGFTNIRIDGEVVELASVTRGIDRYKTHFIELVVDKMIPREDSAERIRDSVRSALNYGKGSIAVLDSQSGEMKYFSKHLVCPDTGMSIPEPAPHTFSFNSPQGACPHCKGIGTVYQDDINKIIPNKKISIAAGGIELLGPMRDNSLFRAIEAIAKKYSFSLHSPIEELPDDIIDLLLYGSDELIRIDSGSSSEMITFPGVVTRLRQNDSESDYIQHKKELFSAEIPCPVCNGTRLKKEALNFMIDGKNIAEVSDMDISDLLIWIESLDNNMDPKQLKISVDIRKELRDRVGFLLDVGLNYLSLSRATKSLSGGETQRIRLATQIGSKLVNVLYILDEPSIGLHQKDNRKLINSLLKLRDEGNSVMVVEHDEEMMTSADWLVDIGPGAGEKGGEILFNGPVESISEDDSVTLQYLKKQRKIDIPATRREGNGKFLELIGATGNNLKSVDIKLPLGCFIGVSGVSGSGKSSLINETLMPILSNHFYRSHDIPLPYKEIIGIKNIDKVIEIDQSPIGRTPRSNPATYTKVFDDIRKLFEETQDAKIRGFNSGRFSFNVKGGRCELCRGAGVQTIEMNFLPSVYVTCNECGGKRYRPDTLAVKYKGKSINDVLEMTISQASEFFANIPSIALKLKTLVDVGLGYVRMGQSSTTLSGGENQRVKLAAELARKSTGNSLYLLDEPTTGLHSEDIKVLLEVLQKITDQGNTVVIIEHNLDILKSVDYIFDMGPEGGKYGGEIVSQGKPEDIALSDSPTAPFLREVLGIEL